MRCAYCLDYPEEKAELTEQKAVFAHLISGQQVNPSGIGVAPVTS